MDKDTKTKPNHGVTEFWLWSMLRARERLLERADKSYDPKACPLEHIEDKLLDCDGDNHYEIARFLDVDGGWRWDCPFCGEHFEE